MWPQGSLNWRNRTKILILVFTLFTTITFGATPREHALKLARNFAHNHPAESVKWDWAEAVFLYGATKYPQLHTYLTTYHRTWLNHVPAINRSDRCPPALSALSFPWASSSVDQVMNYVQLEHRNRLGTIDHLGHSWFSWIYPSSIWVDSLMMYGVLAMKWGVQNQDEAMIEFGSKQPISFASVLQDKESGLFWHAYSFLSGRTIPRGKTFWLRGNGWVVTAIAEILETLPKRPQYELRRKELRDVLLKLSEGLLRYQKENGAWETVINRKNYSYDETSGTLLVAYGWAKAYRLGYLPKNYQVAAKKAFNYGVSKLKETQYGESLMGSSGPTNPGPAIYYKHIGKRTDLAYGVGAFLLAASEFEP